MELKQSKNKSKSMRQNNNSCRAVTHRLFPGALCFFVLFICLLLSWHQIIAPVLPVQAAPVVPVEAKNRSLKIGVSINDPPYSFVDDNGMIKGFNVDLVRAIAIEMGIDIELYAQTSDDLLYNLMHSRLNAIISKNVSGSSYIASDPLIQSQDAIFVLFDNHYISDLNDFWNSPVAIHTQSLTPQVIYYLDRHNAVSPKIVMEQEHGFLLLMNKEVDSYIGNKNAGMYLIQKWNQENYIKMVGEPLNVSEYAFYTNSEDRPLMNQLNNGLAAVLSNQSYEKIYEKWFGESAVSYEKKVKRYLMLMGGTFSLALLIMIFALKWRSMLKKEVERRTFELNQANEALLLQQDILKDKDQFKEDILNSVTTGIITFSKEGLVTSVNAKAQTALDIKNFTPGCSAADIPGLAFLDPQMISNVINRGTFYTNLEGEITVCGQTIILMYQIYPLRNRQGEACGAIVNFEDTSKERRLDEKMSQMNRMKSLDLLVSEFVHEIRTPLTTIKTMVELLPSKFDNLEFRRNMCDIVSMEVQRLNKLVTSLAEYARPKPNNADTFDISTVIDRVIFLLQRKINEENITLDVNMENDLKVAGDPTQLMQVFINLILNSIEAIEKQGHIKIDGYASTDFVCVKIIDNGSGIPEENLKKITDPFFTMRQEGTGLGLYICKKLLEKHNGKMHFHSSLGQGTTVEITLPRASLKAV